MLIRKWVYNEYYFTRMKSKDYYSGRDHQTIVDEWLNLLKRIHIRIQR